MISSSTPPGLLGAGGILPISCGGSCNNTIGLGGSPDSTTHQQNNSNNSSSSSSSSASATNNNNSTSPSNPSAKTQQPTSGSSGSGGSSSNTNMYSLKWNTQLLALQRSLANLWESGIGTDAVLLCQGTPLPVHKIILTAASPYVASVVQVKV